MKRSGGAADRCARILLAVAVFAASLVGIQATVAPSEPAEAADLSQFQPGNIIADALFFNPNTMSVAEIQTFLNARGPACASGYTCLKSFRQNTWDIPATPMCSTYTGAPNESSATIIFKVAQSCGISPKVILVMLQKEQGLVTHSSPSASRYAAAMGAGCPDTAPCDPSYRTFFQQVQYGAYLLKRYTQPPGTGPGTPWPTRYDLWKPIGVASEILYHPNAACGTKSVVVTNQATHSLYVYTPYTPNQAALNAGYATGDGCSSYGNRNFFNFYSDWFGSTQVPPLTNSTTPAALGTPQVGQVLYGSPGAVAPAPQTVTCTWARAGVAMGDATECLYQVRDADVGQQLTVTVTSTRTGYQTLTQTSAPTAAITTPPLPADGFNALAPASIVETRGGNERTADARVQGGGALAPGQTLTVPVLGRAGVPSSGVGAVVLNVTAVAPTEAGFLTVFPTGAERPLTSNLNFAARQTLANTVIAQVGTDGSISIYNPDGTTHVLVDIAGWLPADGYTAVTPARIAETRTGPANRTIDGQVQGEGALQGGDTLQVPVLGRAGVPSSGVGAVVLNVTAVAPTEAGFLTVFPTGAERPLTSNLNFAARQTLANTVIAQVGTDGSISIYNPDGTTHVLVDIAGWLPADGYTAVTPARIAETRTGPANRTIDGQVQGVGAIAPGQTLRVPVLGRADVPTSGVGAVVLNVTAANPTSAGFLTVFPTGDTRPWTSNLNFAARQTLANTVIAHVGTDGSISIYNPDGHTHVLVDIAGWLPG